MTIQFNQVELNIFNYIIFLDDDDRFLSDDSLNIINTYVNYDHILLWKFLFYDQRNVGSLIEKQVTVVEAEVVRGENEDKETRVRFSFIPNIQTTDELKGTEMQGVRRITLVFANLIFLVFQV